MLVFMPATFWALLDVGCGEGSFAGNLIGNGEIWGVEMDPKAAASASAVMNNVLQGSFEVVRDQLPRSYFDIIVCNDVIEHMEDPADFVEYVTRILRPGGIMILSIPNVRHWEVLYQLILLRDWRYTSSGNLDRTHRWFFTKKSMVRLLEKGGFVIESLKGINGPKLLHRRIAFVLLKYLSIGFLDDIRYRNYGIKARLPERPVPSYVES